jgi:hypothetical protein
MVELFVGLLGSEVAALVKAGTVFSDFDLVGRGFAGGTALILVYINANDKSL